MSLMDKSGRMMAEAAGVPIKSIQFAPISLSGVSGTSTETATIEAVDPANTLIFPQTILPGTSGGPYGTIGLELTDPTTITASYYVVSGSLTATILVVVVEFYPGLFKSAPQYVAGGTSPAAITAVDTTKAMIFSLCVLGYNNEGAQSAEIASATSVTVPTSTGSAQYRWCVVEFK